MSMIYVLLFGSLVFALTTQGQPCSKPQGDHMVLKGDAILSNSFPDGTAVSFQCETGYMSVGGSASITCTAGTWSPIRLKCERKNCGSPGEVANGNIDYATGTYFGDKIVITCNTGFRLVGRSEIVCGVDGWMSRLPECEIKTCDPPAKVGNASFSPDKDVYDYREVIQYTCLKGFTLNGSKSISCSEDEIFKPDPPKCILVKCEEPKIADAETVSPYLPLYGYLDTVTHRCTSGFRMEGEPTSTCDINSKWTPGLPQCVVVKCDEPNIANAVRVSGSQPPYGHSATVTYQCNSGFRMEGAPMLTCDINGQWKPGLPECIATTTTTTTTQPSITMKVPAVSVGPTRPPDSGAPNVWQSWLIAILALREAILEMWQQKMKWRCSTLVRGTLLLLQHFWL
ncbi:membrane cofactor protein-like isoform X3 [Thalassophryne amazonica]|uniref:membrane cofactor protein-like isoform X3 n=1 Tax=Thalassophryne amazonica TaxID=390379 RepID=UPI0014712947|nr:membrane cofactor protein-like isoform X3 [Thalassophryne amazonica]